MLKHVSIQNFKSLKNIALDLQPVNLLIGPNNSGKTNFLKALELYPTLNESISIQEFRAVVFKHKEAVISFDFSFVPESDSVFVSYYPEVIGKFLGFSKNVFFEIDNSIHTELENRFIEDIELPLEPILSVFRKEFVDYVTQSIYRPDPSRLAQQVKLSADESKLLPDCSNLISFLYYVDTNFRNTHARQLKEDFSKCVPEISYFTLPPVKIGNESLLGLRFFDKDDNGYWASEASEGVLFFLMLLGIVNQPDPPRLLLLEEPERGIHPRRIREVMDFIFRLAEERNVQIILTTHNEHVLDEFATRPEAVFVFDKDEEGATHVQNLQQDIINPLNQRNRELGLDEVDLTSNLSENWLYGLLGGVPTIS